MSVKSYNLGTVGELQSAETTLVEKIKDIKIGDWYTNCCEEDLQQVVSEQQRRVILEGLEEGCSPVRGVWSSKDEAIKDLTK